MRGLLVLPFLLLIACAQPPEEPEKLRIGFSQPTTADLWRQTMNEEMRREIGFYPEYEIDLIIKDAQDQSEQQIQDIRDLVKLGIDILIVSPNEAAPLTPVVEEVFDQGIPVIVIDRMINSEKYTAYLGGENFDIGKGAAHYAAQLLEGKGKILEITGLKGSTPAIERGKGFYDVLKAYPDIVVESVEGAWLHDQARAITNDLFYSKKDYDLIFAYNDPMAYGAYLSAQRHRIKPFIIGVDGLNTPINRTDIGLEGGIDMVLKGYLDGTFFYPTGGDKTIQLALKAFETTPFSKLNYLKTIRIDASNALTLKNQADQINQQQSRIDKQRDQMGEVTFLLKKQNTISFLSMVISGLLVAIAVMTIYYLNKKSKANRLLDLKNKTIHKQTLRITEQRDQLLRVLRMAEEATETKMRFFTNISHDFRNALSLVIHPVDDLMNHKKDVALKEKLAVVQKNANKLFKLSEEI